MSLSCKNKKAFTKKVKAFFCAKNSAHLQNSS